MNGLQGRLRRFDLALLLAPLLCVSIACTATQSYAFPTPEDAMRAVAEIASISDPNRAEEIFGPGGAELLRSGDPVADREDAQRMLRAIREKVAFEDRDEHTKIALLGNAAWPFPIPLVADHGGWRFDTKAVRAEVDRRRTNARGLVPPS